MKVNYWLLYKYVGVTMSAERKKHIKIIGDQFNKEINKLAIETEKEIQLMVNDSTSAFETMYGRKPSFSDQIGFYDNLIIRFIHSLLVARDVKMHEFIEKNDEKKRE